MNFHSKPWQTVKWLIRFPFIFNFKSCEVIIHDLNTGCKYPPPHYTHIIYHHIPSVKRGHSLITSHSHWIYYSTTAYEAIKMTHIFWNSAHASSFIQTECFCPSEPLCFLTNAAVVRRFKQVFSASAINVTKRRQNILALTQGLWDEVAKFFFCFTVGVRLSHLKKVWVEIPQRCTLMRKRHVAFDSSELESTCEIISSKREHPRLPLTMLSQITSELWTISCGPNMGCGAILLPQKWILSETSRFYASAFYMGKESHCQCTFVHLPANYTTVQSSTQKNSGGCRWSQMGKLPKNWW